MTGLLDEAHLRQWIGREEVAEDILTRVLAERFHATLELAGPVPRDGDIAPRLIHFCLCQPSVSMAALDEDGHPARGGFLPPVQLPRRMWAGSAIEFHGDLKVGSPVRRSSRIADVVVKSGRSGVLCFVTIEHRIASGETCILQERQTIVYREPPRAVAATAVPDAPAPLGRLVATRDPTSAQLFRYSALTFNAHRIHYDRPFATEIEAYPGLVVHGPLQATWLLHHATHIAGRPPARFDFSSQSALFDHDTIALHATTEIDGAMKLWTARAGGLVAMQAEARWT